MAKTKSTTKMGRPPSAKPRTVTVGLRLSEEEAKAIRARASELGVSVSQLARVLLRRDAGLPTL